MTERMSRCPIMRCFTRRKIDNVQFWQSPKELEGYADEEHEGGEEIVQDTSSKKLGRFSRVIRNIPVCYAALSYALQKKG